MRKGAFSFFSIEFPFHVHACSKRWWMQATSSNLGRSVEVVKEKAVVLEKRM